MNLKSMHLLNSEFPNLGLTTIDVSDEVLNWFSNTFFKFSLPRMQKGSHYTIKGPFLLPNAEQVMSDDLIISCWIFLMAINRLFPEFQRQSYLEKVK